MRVALLGLHYAEYVVALANALAARHEVLLVLESGNADAELGARPHAEPSMRVEYVTHRADPRAAVAQAAHLRRLIRDFAPDVIHAQEVIYDSWVLLLSRLRRYPLVLTVHDPHPHSGEDRMRGLRRRYPLYQSLQRRRADMAITHGSRLVEDLENVVPSLRGRVASVPHGVLGSLPQDAPARAFSTDGSVLFLGRMVAYKGLHVFLDAVEELRARGRDIRPVLAGRGPALDEARECLAGMSDVVVTDRFLSREEMLELVDGSAVVALPYIDGTQSGVALLAIGRGRPVLASEVGSLPEVCRDGVNGMLIPPNDVAALANALQALLDDPARLRLLADGAKRLAGEEFSWDAIAGQTTRVYERAVLSRRPPARARRRSG